MWGAIPDGSCMESCRELQRHPSSPSKAKVGHPRLQHLPAPMQFLPSSWLQIFRRPQECCKGVRTLLSLDFYLAEHTVETAARTCQYRWSDSIVTELSYKTQTHAHIPEPRKEGGGGIFQSFLVLYV